MKNKLAAASAILMFTIWIVGCGSLNKNAKGLNMNQTIPAQSRMLIQLEDKSGFKIDIENLSTDTLVLERKGLDNLMITRASIKAIVEPDASSALLNSSNREVKVQLRIYDHKSKVVHTIEKMTPEAKTAQ